MVKPFGIAADDDIRFVRRPALRNAVDEGRDFVADAELEPSGRRERCEDVSIGLTSQPGKNSSPVVGGPSDRAPQRASSRMTGSQLAAVVGELVDP